MLKKGNYNNYDVITENTYGICWMIGRDLLQYIKGVVYIEYIVFKHLLHKHKDRNYSKRRYKCFFNNFYI